VVVGTTKVLPSNSAVASLHLLELIGKDHFLACERMMFSCAAGSFVGHPWILRKLLRILRKDIMVSEGSHEKFILLQLLFVFLLL
jgi:hypothetical protein